MIVCKKLWLGYIKHLNNGDIWCDNCEKEDGVKLVNEILYCESSIKGKTIKHSKDKRIMYPFL